MGCSNCLRKDNQTEMKNGHLPEEDINTDEKTNENNKLVNNNININTDFLTSNQMRNEEIFNYFNKIRDTPDNFSEEAKNYDLNKIITLAIKRKSEDNINKLIQNHFINLFLDTFVQKSPNSRDEIFKNLEESIQLKNYEKFLYFSEGPIEKPNECVWNLLKENKEKAIDEILYKKIDYLIISTIVLPGTKKINAYFLLLKKIPD